VKYKVVNFGPAGITNAIHLRYSKSTALGGMVEVRLGSPTGEVIGDFAPLTTGGDDVWKETSVELTEGIEGIQDVYFVGSSSNSDAIFSLDWLQFGNLEFSQRMWLVCGRIGNCLEGDFGHAEIDELHEVRCCSDSTKPGWVKHDWCNVWGGANLPTCYHSETFTSAAQICSDNGARLCTKTELEAGCTQGSGCEHDADQIWSSTPHQEPSGHWLACGSSEGTCSGEEHFAFDNEFHEVRCCSDTALSTDNQSACPELGVFGYSQLFQNDSGGCFHAETYAAAEMICSNFGGRLCTRDELHADCTKNSGCGHDHDLIWTSDIYGGGLVGSGGGLLGSDILDQLPQADNHEPFISNGHYDGLMEVVGKPESTQEVPLGGINDYLTVGGGFGSLSSLGDLQGLIVYHPMWLACGKMGECPEGFLSHAYWEEKHEVRCCSESEKPGWVKQPWCDVWGESDLPACFHESTFEEAADICARNGGRLCTKEELEFGCASQSGCGHDQDLVWSGTIWNATENAGHQHMIACGSSEQPCAGYARLADDFETHEVRCCADNEVLGWAKQENCAVWGESKIGSNGACHSSKTYDQAHLICKAHGGRLCTKEELLTDCTESSGCNFDDDMIWSSSTS